jgi:hypothetical protein
MSKKNTQFVATFQLSQDGPDGEVHSVLTFDPKVNETGDNAPGAYELMAYLAQCYLEATGVIDENGDLIDPETFHRNTLINVRERSGKLN